MKRMYLPILAVFLPIAALASTEGVPVYYRPQTQNTPATVSTTPTGKTIVGQKTYSYAVPAAPAASSIPDGAMTANGVSGLATSPLELSVDYARKYATFEFKTGVNSILKWNDMLMDEIGVRARWNFDIRGVDLFAEGEYRYGNLGSGGKSMDYDLDPYDYSQPDVGIFTISMGGMSGDENYLRVGIGARDIWDIGGWKITPSIGYERFQHNLKMSDHIYPNQGTYIPMLTNSGNYVFGDDNGNFYSVAQSNSQDAIDQGMYQVCMSPEDMRVVNDGGGNSGIVGMGSLGNVLNMQDGSYAIDPNGNTPWGVMAGDCVIIGGDGQIKVSGTTHIYDTTWSGIYIGLELAKQMTLKDKLRFYAQFGLPNYRAEGTWPNRTDWQQYPSFIDEGSNSAYSYQLEGEYIYQATDRLALSLKVDTQYYRVGAIAGKLFVAAYSTWATDDSGNYLYDANNQPYIVTVNAHTEKIKNDLKYAYWQSFGLHLGIKYSF